MQPTAASAVLANFHRTILRIGVWLLPTIFVLDNLSQVIEHGRPDLSTWWIYVILWLPVRWQLRRPFPSAIWFLGLASVLIVALRFAYEISGVEFVTADSATTMVVLVALGMMISVLLYRRHRWFSPVYGIAILVIAVATGVDDQVGLNILVLRTIAATSMLWLGSVVLTGLRGDLLVALDNQQTTARAQTALAEFSSALLAAESEAVLPAAISRLGRGIGVELRHDDGKVSIAGTGDEPDNTNRADLGSYLIAANNMLTSFKDRLDTHREMQRLVDSKEQLITTVSHELRTPLTGILGFAETIRESADELAPEDFDRFFEVIVAQSRDMADIVEDLLASARADGGTLSIRPEPVDFAELANNVVAGGRVNELAGGKTLHLIGGGVLVNADPLRVRQIIRNLITNALRYGGSTVEVRLGVEGDYGLLEVADDGDGLPTLELEQLFEPFYTSNQTPSQPGSVGLGLTLSRTLARLMGGDVSADRRDGWTVFGLRLPVAVRADLPT